MASAAEAKICAILLNDQETILICTTLADLGHNQPPTLIHVDNSTAAGFSNDAIKQKVSKSIDIRFYWIQDRICRVQFLIYWSTDSTNIGDYFTKYNSPNHHRLMHPIYLHSTTLLANFVIANIIRGYVNLTGQVSS